VEYKRKGGRVKKGQAGKDRHKASPIVFRANADTHNVISKIAIEQKKSKSEVLRQLVNAGLVASGYKQDEEYLVNTIQAAVQSALKPSVERLAAISAKAAHISGAAFFMNVYMGQLVLPPEEKELVNEAAAQARKLGIEYLKVKLDQDVDGFIAGGVKKMENE